MSSKNKNNILKGLFFIAILIAIGFGYHSIRDYLLSDYETTTGIITKHSEWYSKGGYFIEYTYSVDNKEYKSTSSGYYPLDCFDAKIRSSCRGVRIKIKYSKKHPSVSEIVRE